MKRVATLTLLATLVLAACGGDSKGSADVEHGTMEAVYAAFSRLPKATYKAEFDAQGATLEHITVYWKDGNARIDTVSTGGTTRHYAKGAVLIACDERGAGCIQKLTPQGFSFRLHSGPDSQKQLATAREAGGRPSTRKILGQTVECWQYDQTATIIEQDTCVNEDGAVMYYKGGNRDDPYQAIAVSYSTEVSDAEVKAPPAEKEKFDLPLGTTTTSVPG